MTLVKPLEAVKPSITVLLGIVLSAAILGVARGIVIPIALSVLLTFVLAPAVVAMQRRHVSRPLAVLIVSVAALVLIGGGAVVIALQVHDLAQDIPDHKNNIVRKIQDIKGEGPSALDRLIQMIDEITAELQPANPQKGPAIPVTIQEEKKTGVEVLTGVASPLIGILGSIGLVVALTITMLFKREDLRDRFLHLSGHGRLTSTTRAIDEATKRISRYLVLQVIVNSGFGLVFGVVLALLGVPYAFLCGVLAAVLRFIPYIGTWLAAFFPLVVSIAVAEGWLQPILVVVFAVVIGLITNNVLEPLLISRTTGVSPVALVVAAAFWTWLWGPIGLILSTPITVCLAVLGRYVSPLQFLAVLLGSEPALDPQKGFYQRLLARDEDEATQVVTTYLAKNASFDQLCDKVLIPTLVQAKEDHAVGNLPREEFTYIIQATREVMETDLPSGLEPQGAAPNPPAFLLGCSAKDEVDELALRCFQHLVGQKCRLEILGPGVVAAEILDRVRQEKPSGVLIVALPPGGLAKVRYLCKRLRGAFPEIPLAIGYWGLPVDETKLIEQLRAVGADHVATTMAESLNQLGPLVQQAPYLQVDLVEAKPNEESANRIHVSPKRPKGRTKEAVS